MPAEKKRQQNYSTITHSIMLGLAVLALSLFGILSRLQLDLATFWPANAFVLGMLVRFPGLARPASWLSAAAGFLIADTVTGSSWWVSIILNGGNLLAIATGYGIFRLLPLQDRSLASPRAVLCFLRAILAAACVAGLIGFVAHPPLFGGTPLEGLLFWSATEAVNHAAFLPLLLTLPPLTKLRIRNRRKLPVRSHLVRAMPLIALMISAMAAAIVGGPGALAFPVPALLWCALSYSLFSTACLTFAFGAWTLLTIRTGIMPMGIDTASREMLISIRVGVTLVALGPLVVASVMASREELLEKMRRLAEEDAMTGLRNRRSFFETGSAALQSKADRARDITVMMLDIDHFKAINDRHGHDGGDMVLVGFAEILKKNVRDTDIIGRWGGEEFAVLMPGCDAKAAASTAQRIIEAMRSERFRSSESAPMAATVSIGVHTDRSNTDLERRLMLADRALYQAKEAGRDQFIMSAIASQGLSGAIHEVIVSSPSSPPQ